MIEQVPDPEGVRQQARWRSLLYEYLLLLGGVLRVLAIILPFPMASLARINDSLVEHYGPPKATLSVRAQEVTDALATAEVLLDELQAEVKARAALIEALEGETREAEQRADDAIRRRDLSEGQARAVDAYLDRAMKNRIEEFEKGARKREWGLATVGAVVTGLVAILIAHFLFGF